MRLWKGLYYCLWHAPYDHPDLQQEVIDSIVSLQVILARRSPAEACLFYRTMWDTMAREWIHVDKYRISKFYSLMRKVQTQTFRLAAEAGWSDDWVEPITDAAAVSVLAADRVGRGDVPGGVVAHYMDVFLPCLRAATADAGLPPPPPARFTELTIPMFMLLVAVTSKHIARHFEDGFVLPLTAVGEDGFAIWADVLDPVEYEDEDEDQPDQPDQEPEEVGAEPSDLQEPDADVTASDAGVDDSDMGASDALDGGSELDDDALAALGESSGVPTLAEMVAALIDEPDCRNRKLLHKLLNYMAILTFPQHAEASEAEASAADESS
jgi:hypothetical protein